MNLVIVHFHLNRGGVAGVIANHLRALDTQVGPISVALFHGGRAQGWPSSLADEMGHLDLSEHTIPQLEYDDQVSTHPGATERAQLGSQLIGKLQSLEFCPEETVVHVHNHALGKNIELPAALGQLAQAGYGLLLQVHDFAEDFRPDNYRRMVTSLAGDDGDRLPALLYPQGSRVHYAVLNRRDFSILAKAGVASTRLHYLPNVVTGSGLRGDGATTNVSEFREQARQKLSACFGVSTDTRYLLYPVRGIRRKNLGEALLWSAVVGTDATVGITLTPLNPLERRAYLRWKELAAELRLSCLFEVGGEDGLAFAENLSAADMILTTSVAEGFGLVFLETWLANRQLLGRDLPEITADFKNCGIKFDGLCRQLLVPVEWVGEQTFCRTFGEIYGQVLLNYGLPVPAVAELSARARELIKGSLVDFAALPIAMQRAVVATVVRNKADREQVQRLNESLWLAVDGSPEAERTVRENAAIVRERYSLSTCGKRLWRIYEGILKETPSGQLAAPTLGETILESFLQLQRFHPLRIES